MYSRGTGIACKAQGQNARTHARVRRISCGLHEARPDRSAKAAFTAMAFLGLFAPVPTGFPLQFPDGAAYYPYNAAPRFGPGPMLLCRAVLFTSPQPTKTTTVNSAGRHAEPVEQTTVRNNNHAQDALQTQNRQARVEAFVRREIN